MLCTEDCESAMVLWAQAVQLRYDIHSRALLYDCQQSSSLPLAGLRPRLRLGGKVRWVPGNKKVALTLLTDRAPGPWNDKQTRAMHKRNMYAVKLRPPKSFLYMKWCFRIKASRKTVGMKFTDKPYSTHGVWLHQQVISATFAVMTRGYHWWRIVWSLFTQKHKWYLKNEANLICLLWVRVRERMDDADDEFVEFDSSIDRAPALRPFFPSPTSVSALRCVYHLSHFGQRPRANANMVCAWCMAYMHVHARMHICTYARIYALCLCMHICVHTHVRVGIYVYARE